VADPASTIARADVRVVQMPAWVTVLRVAGSAPGLDKLLGAPLPGPITAAGEEPRLLWLAPGEWAIVSLSQDTTLTERLTDACRGQLAHVADLMEGWAGFEISGGGARDLLAAGCSLDLHPRVFPDNGCARSLLAGIPAVIDRRGDAFHLHVDRSHARHLRSWLAVSTGA
jgi:sarcosine oxidase subunit gamma